MSAIAQRTRSGRQAWAAPGSSHDRLVSILGVGLPIAIGVLAAFLVMAPLTAGGNGSPSPRARRVSKPGLAASPG